MTHTAATEPTGNQLDLMNERSTADVCIPARDETTTAGRTISGAIVVVDVGSTDRTGIVSSAEPPPADTRQDRLFGIPRLGHATLLGAVAGLILVIAGMGLAVVLTDLPAAYLAAGVHAGLFGGIGSGAMLAGVTQATRSEAAPAEPRASSPHPRNRAIHHPLTIDPRETDPA